MFDYTGYECKCCSKKFTSDDDIVVCPECGTPYHRECYLKEGKCINNDLHARKISWKASIEGNSAENISCKNCGGSLKSEQLFCDKCGAPTSYYFNTHLSDSDEKKNDYSKLYNNTEQSDQLNMAMFPYMINYSDPLCGFNPEEEYENGVTTKDLADFVGTSTHFYLPKFKLMKIGHFKFSMNIPALFFPGLYFAYRKMPLTALLILIIKAVIELPAMVLSLQTMLSDPDMLSMFNTAFPSWAEAAQKMTEMNFNSGSFSLLYNFSTVLNWAMIIIFGCLSNFIYYRYSLKKISRIKKEAAESGTDCSELIKEYGGTSPMMLGLFIVLYFILQTLSMWVIMMFI